jgi:hypothetical protein
MRLISFIILFGLWQIASNYDFSVMAGFGEISVDVR